MMATDEGCKVSQTDFANQMMHGLQRRTSSGGTMERRMFHHAAHARGISCDLRYEARVYGEVMETMRANVKQHSTTVAQHLDLDRDGFVISKEIEDVCFMLNAT